MANYSETLAALQAASTSAGDKLILTPAVYTAGATAAGKVLFEFEALAGVTTAAGRISMLQDIVAVAKNDIAPSITLLFANSAITLGTAGGDPSISDADALKITGTLLIPVADWIDLGGVRVQHIRNLGTVLKPLTTSSYVGAIITAAGTGGTFAAGDLQLAFGILQG
jgi:hypothetical protein